MQQSQNEYMTGGTPSADFTDVYRNIKNLSPSPPPQTLRHAPSSLEERKAASLSAKNENYE